MDYKGKITRAFINNNNCVMGAEAGPQTIVVRQVIGERETQKVLDIHITIPDRKPAIEQIIDVFVKNLKVLSVDVITNRIIVRGDLEIKAIYVADLPEQPVHAVEVKHYKFTQEVDIPGARRGMDAEASVSVNFVDYNVDECTRAYKYKNFEHMCDDEDDDDYDSCEEMADSCETMPISCEKMAVECPEKKVATAMETVCTVVKAVSLATRDFDVSVVLGITAKVMTDREVIIGYTPVVQEAAAVVKPAKKPVKPAAKKPVAQKPVQTQLPAKPKG